MQYHLTELGYTLTDDDGTVLFANQPEIALVVDIKTGILHEHGPVAPVQAWHQKTQADFRAIGFGHLADYLICFSAAFNVEDLNRCLTKKFYAGKLLKRFLAEQH